MISIKSSLLFFALISVAGLLATTTTTPAIAHPSQSGEPSVNVDDIKCQVCDTAVSFYARTLLATNLYCLGFTNKSKTMGYVVQALQPFAISTVNPEFCLPDAREKLDERIKAREAASASSSAPKAQETPSTPSSSSAPSDSDEEEAEQDPSAGSDEENPMGVMDKKIKREQEKKDQATTTGDSSGGVADETAPSFALDESAVVEIARKAYLCKKFIPSFPAVEVFAGAGEDSNKLGVDDLMNMKDAPGPTNPRFTEILVRACDVTVAAPKKNMYMIEEVRKIVAAFPIADGPRTVGGARNHVYKKLTKEAQEQVCSKACDPTIKRPENVKIWVAFNTDGFPVLQ